MKSKSPGRATVLLLVGVVTVGAMASSVNADPIPVTVPNAGFEDRETFDPFADGIDKYNQWALEAWRHFEVDNNGGPLRIWNPGDPGDPAALIPQGIADVGFEGEAPEGHYVVVVRSRYNDDEFHNPPQVRDFEAAVQLLNETFDPTMTYTLSAEVGRLVGSDNYTPLWNGYALQLAVGGTNVDGARYQGRTDGGVVIAEDFNSLVVPEDEFVTATVTYTPDPAHADLAGLPLQIRLAALEDPDDHSLSGWVAFDDVQLTVDEADASEICDNGVDDDGDGGADCDDDDCADAESCQPQGNSFTRGDANTDGNVDISDPTTTLQYLFLGGSELRCMDAADGDDDGMLSLTDAIYVLNHLFLGTPAPPAPYPGCGRDETVDGFECETSPANCE